MSPPLDRKDIIDALVRHKFPPTVFASLSNQPQPKGTTTSKRCNQEPGCDRHYGANTARDMKIDVAVKNNFGFGGTNGTLVFKRLA